MILEGKIKGTSDRNHVMSEFLGAQMNNLRQPGLAS